MNVDQIRLFERAQLAACDALDGLKDGIPGNVAACHYDPVELQCKHGERGSNACLTAGQIESIRMIYVDKHVDVQLADGVVGCPGHEKGAKSVEWPAFVFGSSFAARDPFNYVAANNIIKHGITNDPNASVMTHQPEEWAKEYLALSNEIDATNPDLSAFQAHGGKLIVWYGVGDGCVSYKRTVDYLEEVEKRLGADTTEELPLSLRLGLVIGAVPEQTTSI